MKKILTLLIALGAFVALQAQTREEARRVILGGSKDNGSYGGRDGRDVVLGRNENGRYPNRSSADRRYQIDQINEEYDNKINSIRNNRYLDNEEKERAIRQLERDRQRRISEVNRQYRDGDRRYNDDDRYSKGNNGKHKGWYKKNKNKNWKKGNKDRNWDDD